MESILQNLTATLGVVERLQIQHGLSYPCRSHGGNLWSCYKNSEPVLGHTQR